VLIAGLFFPPAITDMNELKGSRNPPSAWGDYNISAGWVSDVDLFKFKSCASNGGEKRLDNTSSIGPREVIRMIYPDITASRDVGEVVGGRETEVESNPPKSTPPPLGAVTVTVGNAPHDANKETSATGTNTQTLKSPVESQGSTSIRGAVDLLGKLRQEVLAMGQEDEGYLGLDGSAIEHQTGLCYKRAGEEVPQFWSGDEIDNLSSALLAGEGGGCIQVPAD